MIPNVILKVILRVSLKMSLKVSLKKEILILGLRNRYFRIQFFSVR